ncbi:MAG: ATP-binding protein [Endomicrobium sp.]|jgi:hypothetical protein|nr:ATP-binding protein [Endomicrobium sp.]
MRRLPIGVQDFEDMITSGYVYVDKTDLVYKLVTGSKQYFLGRPRRFGKSLLVSTLKAYFQGKRELFKGLAMEKLENEWKSYPVIHLDMGGADCSTIDTFNAWLMSRLKRYENEWGLPNNTDGIPSSQFIDLIVNINKKACQKVVILIDEYDKPLIETLGDEETNDLFRAKLRYFYGALKSADEYLRFTFLTGVTKFSQVSVFSDLNHLADISMNYKYANICGITAEELFNNFEPELLELAQAKGMNIEEVMGEMKARYDGYSFCSKIGGIYNPFSVLNTLDIREFRNYWFRTGTPTFLVKSLAKSSFNLVEFNDGITVTDDELTDYRAGSDNVTPLLYQSGYLTIKTCINNKYTMKYVLGFPNAEVRYGFTQELFNYYTPNTKRQDFDAEKFVQDLHNRDVDGFMHRFQSFFASIPYILISKFTAEAHYQSIVFVIATLMGQHAAVEVYSNKGRSDLEITLPDTRYIIEFKLNKKDADTALAQINNKGYAEQYMVGECPIIKIGVLFDQEKRNIVEWVYDTATPYPLQKLEY